MKLFSRCSFVFIIITIIFTSGYALSTVDIFFNLKFPLLIISFALLGLINLLKHPTKHNQKTLGLVIFIIVFSLFCTILNNSSVNVNSFILFSFVLILAFLFVKVVDFNTFLRGFVYTMSIISTIALFVYFLTNVINIDLNFPHITNANGTTYQNGLICFRILYSSGYSSRIMGLFWEPGLFASYVTIAFLIEILTNGKSKYKKIIFFVSLLISQSTAGYLLLIVCLLIWGLRLNGIKRYFFEVFIFISGLFFVLNFNQILEFLVGTGLSVFTKLDLNANTTSIRIESFLTNMEIFSISPLYGVGLGEANNLFEKITSGLVSQTSTTTYFMASFGVLGLLFTLIPIFAGIKIGIKKRSFIIGILLPIIILFILNKEPHSSFTIDFIFIIYLFENFLIKKKQSETLGAIKNV